MNRKERRNINRAIARNMKKVKKESSDKIQSMAEEFVRLEKEIQAGVNVNQNKKAQAILTESLTYSEIFAIDEYIQSHQMLTK